MTATLARSPADTDRTWRAEFRALVLEIDRQAVALDLRYWLRIAPGDALSVTEHLQLLRRRWHALPVVAPSEFVPEPPPVPRVDPVARAVRPAALLRSWRREGGSFPDRLAAGYAHAGETSADRVGRQHRAELAALRRCLAAFHAARAAAPANPDR